MTQEKWTEAFKELAKAIRTLDDNAYWGQDHEETTVTIVHREDLNMVLAALERMEESL